MMAGGITSARRPMVLSMLGAFWPGNDSSGPNQSYKAMATALAADFEFRLVARDRPFESGEVVAGTADEWIDHHYWRARHLAVGRIAAVGLGKVLRSSAHDVLWLNGFFDREFTIPALLMRRMGRVPGRPTILSPRGEFAVGALGLKSPQKRAYLALCKGLGLLEGVTLHATSEDEARVFRAALPWAREIAVAPNIRRLVDVGHVGGGGGDGVRLAFIGRIARVKNLDYALRVLALTRTRVHMDIYGPVQEADYWRECEALIRQLPDNVTVRHRGEVGNDEIPDALSRSDLLLLPTMGENFGHAIFEALSCGVPVLISDTTPWRGLALDRAGWDLPLADPAGFARVIDAITTLDQPARLALRRGARARAERWVIESGAVEKTKAMLSRETGRTAATTRNFPRADG
jgi:glycosyltransferase involved in cell wall biosynthesis